MCKMFLQLGASRYFENINYHHKPILNFNLKENDSKATFHKCSINKFTENGGKSQENIYTEVFLVKVLRLELTC